MSGSRASTTTTGEQDARFQEPQLSRHLALVERLKVVADRHETTPGAVAIAWTLRNPAVDGAIVGLRRPDQVDVLVPAASLELSDEDVADLEGGSMTAIGFVGLGAMGSRIAGRLLACGHDVSATNRTRGKADALLERGLVWRDSPREVAEHTDVLFSMVTDTAALEAITDGPRRSSPACVRAASTWK